MTKQFISKKERIFMSSLFKKTLVNEKNRTLLLLKSLLSSNTRKPVNLNVDYS